MKAKYFKFLNLAISFGGAFICLGILLISPPDFSGLYPSKKVMRDYVEGEYSYFPLVMDAGGPSPVIKVEWKIILNYPEKAERDSTILVEAKPEITRIDKSKWTSSNSFLGQKDLDENQIREEVWRDLEEGILRLNLSLPSAKISPNELVSFNEQHASAWSVYFPIPGIHKGIVLAELMFEGPVKLRQQNDGIVTIEVYEPLLSRKNVLSIIGLILGPLVSIPGFYAFMRERKKDKVMEQNK